MPISTPADVVNTYHGDIKHFEHVLDHLFEPALEKAGYEVVKPAVVNSEIIQAEFIRNLEMADLVLCDISMWNANVFFELGIRVALNRPVVMVRDSETNGIPFDAAIVSCHTYRAELAPWLLPDEIESLANFVRSAGKQKQNALWRYFGITRRSEPSETESSPVEEKLDILLRLVTADSRSGRSLPEPVRVAPEQSKVEDPAALAIISGAAEIAKGLHAEISVDRVDEDEIVFDLKNFFLDDPRIRRIVDLGKGTRYRVQVIGDFIPGPRDADS